jgi:competence protein ComEC
MGGWRSSAPVAIGVAAAAAIALAHTGEIHRRADAALGSGMPPREAELARGFVLGEDGGMDPRTVADFRRAGLSHLLAVSGQNVALLALLAMPVLALLGLPLRARLLWVIGLIAVYVPLAGAGASIQRAGVMGALSVFATLRGRRSSRLHALAVAAIVTLAIDPGVAADVGWQLSFAAVLGIALLAAPLSATARARLRPSGPVGRAVLDGAAMTVAATLATAPLIAFHFGEVSTMTLLANLLALPAVAPAMWVGMLSAAGGQVPGFPVAALNAVEAPLLGYIAQIAAWCGRPSWACLEVRLGPLGLLGSYAAVLVAALVLPMLARRRRLAAIRARRGPPSPRRRKAPRGALALMLAAALGALALGGTAAPPSLPAVGLRITVLDVGQGDAILFQPAAAPPILVDGGPLGDGLPGLLRERGAGRLAAAIVTHDQADHVGGIAGMLGEIPVERLLYGVADRRLLEESEQAGAATRRVGAGAELRSGRLRLDFVWPPPELLAGPHAGEDPNRLALVIVARWGRFSMLLTADAEAESTPIDPGPIDVLKVSHHGSDDAGLDELLDRTAPRLAVISVGKDNPYGHPTRSTLAALAAHGVHTLRTDRDGSVVIEVAGAAVEAYGEG